jgi:tetratricopeptide (TPR) repeat protein
VISVRTGLARTLSLRGALLEALHMREAILHDRVQLLGTQHADVAMDHYNLATNLMRLGRNREAERKLIAAHALLTTLLGPEHFRTQFVGANLARTYVELGQFAKAKKALDALLDYCEKYPDNAKGLLVSVHSSLAVLSFYQRQLDIAQKHAEHALTQSTEAHQQAALHRRIAMIALAMQQAPRVANSYAEFAQDLRSKGGDPSIDPWLSFTDALVQFTLDASPEKLSAVRKLFAEAERTQGARNLEYYDAAVLMGSVERESKNYARAVALHESLMAIAVSRELLGDYALAIANAEIALTLYARNAGGDAIEAARHAALALAPLRAIAPSDERLARLVAIAGR